MTVNCYFCKTELDCPEGCSFHPRHAKGFAICPECWQFIAKPIRVYMDRLIDQLIREGKMLGVSA